MLSTSEEDKELAKEEKTKMSPFYAEGDRKFVKNLGGLERKLGRKLLLYEAVGLRDLSFFIVPITCTGTPGLPFKRLAELA